MSFRVKARGAEIFTQRVQASTEDLRRRDQQTSKLLAPRTELGQDPAMLQEALEELRFHHDATVLAEEKLRTQLDELTRLGLRIESERARYVDLFEHAPDPYLVTDGMGVIRDANAAAVGLFGLEYRFLRGKPLAGFLERGHGIHAALDKLTRSGEALGALECTVLPRGGDPVAVVARVSLSARSRGSSGRFAGSPRPLQSARRASSGHYVTRTSSSCASAVSGRRSSGRTTRRTASSRCSPTTSARR